MASKKPKIESIEDLHFDNQNINKGSEYGTALLHKSMAEVGAGRSVPADKNGVLISGNKTVEAAGAVGITKIKVVETYGDELVVVQRMDLDINTEMGAKAKIFDNTVSKHNYVEDAEIAAAVCESVQLEPAQLGLSQPGTNFNPNVNPTYNHSVVDEGDMDEAGKKLKAALEQRGTFLEVICPHCGETFEIAK